MIISFPHFKICQMIILSLRPIHTQKKPINKTFSGRTDGPFTGGEKKQSSLTFWWKLNQTRLYNLQGLLFGATDE